MKKELLIKLVLITLATFVTSCAQQEPAEIVMHKSLSRKISENNNPYKIKIKVGDTLYKLSKEFNVEVRSLIDSNELRAPYLLTPGQKLVLPKALFHTVDSGDTVYAISRSYGVDMNRLITVNNLNSPYSLRKGQKLRLPSKVSAGEEARAQIAQNPAKEEPEFVAQRNNVEISDIGDIKPSRTVQGVPEPLLRANTEPSPILKPAAKYASRPADIQAETTKYAENYKPVNFKWPTSGRIISSFGPKDGGLYNDGINISVTEGTPVIAAEDGTVVYSGNELRGYGNLLLIKHNNGFLTAYAHTKDMKVSKGQAVSKGQVIALVGKTGHVSKPQLHFSIRKGRKAIDPMIYLPQKS